MTETIEIEEKEMNWYCWVLVSGLADWIPEGKSARECMITPEELEGEVTPIMESYDSEEELEKSLQHEIGYHTGAAAMTEEHIRHARFRFDIDVLNRAERYRHECEYPEDDSLSEFGFPGDWLQKYGGNYVFGEEEVEEYIKNGGNIGEDYGEQIEKTIEEYQKEKEEYLL